MHKIHHEELPVVARVAVLRLLFHGVDASSTGGTSSRLVGTAARHAAGLSAVEAGPLLEGNLPLWTFVGRVLVAAAHLASALARRWWQLALL